MFCPRCSQERISDEIKFCSRCGLPLDTVAEVVAGDGFLPQLAELGKKGKVFTRRNGLLLALFWFMFFVMILTPITDITGSPKQVPAIMALLGTIGAFFFIIISFAVLKKEPKEFAAPVQNSGAPDNVKFFHRKNQNALPAQQSIPASTFVSPPESWRDTKDLIQPSVTEGTTKLLSKDER